MIEAEPMSFPPRFVYFLEQIQSVAPFLLVKNIIRVVLRRKEAFGDTAKKEGREKKLPGVLAENRFCF